MSHIFSHLLKEVRLNTEPRAGITVRTCGDGRFQLMLQDKEIKIVPHTTSFVALPKRWKITDKSGREILANDRFWVSMASCDPLHIVIDAPEEIMS